MPFSSGPVPSDPAARHRTLIRGWTLLALSALGAAGALALALALSRTPVVGGWLPWGSDFFYRALITHVVLSFQVWFLAMGAVLALLAQGPEGGLPGGKGAAAHWALRAAWIAFLLLLIPALADRGQPLLNNYVPVLVHPLFIAALAALALAVAVTMTPCIGRMGRGETGAFGMGVAALALWSALLCMGVAAWLVPSGDNLEFRVERIVWGGGHVGQVFNTVLLLTAWQGLAVRVFGRGPLPGSVAKAALGGLALFVVLAPAAYGLAPVAGLESRLLFTRFLWLALPLALGLFALGLGGCFLRHPPRWRDPAEAALALSLAVTVLGGLAGFFLGVGDTRTPSHYHAVIGGVNLGLMGVFPAMILPLLKRLPEGRPSRFLSLSLLLYGGGQALHAAGFYAAGLAGVPRKTEGLEQGLNTAAKLLSMGLVGIGGTIAVLGGIGFIWIALGCLLKPEGRDAKVFRLPEEEGGGKRAAGAVALLSAALAAWWLVWRPPQVQEGGGDAQTIDVAMRQWAFDAGEPVPHLVAGRRYRFHFHTSDVIHSAAILGREVLVVPDRDRDVTVDIPNTDQVRLQCGEFCGNGHSRMTLVFPVDRP